MPDKKTKNGTASMIKLGAIILGIMGTLSGMTFAYATVVYDTQANTIAIEDNTQDIGTNNDELTDMKILMNELLYINSDIAETLKEIKINTEND